MNKRTKYRREWIEYDLASAVVKNMFYERYPKGKRPDWLDSYITTISEEDQDGDLMVMIALEHKFHLKPNERWIQGKDGGSILVSIDLVTGKEGVVICDGGQCQHPKIIFKAKINLGMRSETKLTIADVNASDIECANIWKSLYPNSSITVIMETDLDGLERSEYRQVR